MNKLMLFVLIAVLCLSAINVTVAKDKIGVYDSRMIAVWYFNTPEYQKSIKDMRDSAAAAKKNNDTEKIKYYDEIGILTQRVLHDKGFGRGSVAEILEKKKAELAELAKNEKLIAIVSKWEVNYSSTDVELVDVTLKLLELLKAPENIKNFYDSMKVQPPVENAFFMNPLE